jgi:hypothetical protein
LVGGDVIYCVGCGLGGVDLHRAHLDAVDVGLDAEVEVGLRPRDGRAKVGVGRADLEEGGVVACPRGLRPRSAGRESGEKSHWHRRLAGITWAWGDGANR